jgi:hypothetical protein
MGEQGCLPWMRQTMCTGRKLAHHFSAEGVRPTNNAGGRALRPAVLSARSFGCPRGGLSLLGTTAQRDPLADSVAC